MQLVAIVHALFRYSMLLLLLWLAVLVFGDWKEDFAVFFEVVGGFEMVLWCVRLVSFSWLGEKLGKNTLRSARRLALDLEACLL